MATGGINSSFQFQTYKIDRIEYQTTHDIGLLQRYEAIDTDKFEIFFRIRVPNRIKKEKIYISGFDVKFIQYSDDSRMEEKFIFKGEMGIVGIFKVMDDSFDEDQINSLAKIQAPALLLPYLRSAITSLFTNNGFGSFIFPLINIHKLAESSVQDLEIVDLEQIPPYKK